MCLNIGKMEFYFSDLTISLIFSNIFFLALLLAYNRNEYVNFFLDYIFSSVKEVNKKYLDSDFSILSGFVLIYIAFLNFIGCFSFFPVTALSTVPFIFSVFLFLYSFVNAFMRKGIRTLTDLVPSQLPLAFKVVFLPLELFSVFLKPAVIGIRLLVNMLIGHMIKEIVYDLLGSIGIKGYLGIPLIFFINCMEIFKSILQTYLFFIFSILMMKSFSGTH